MSKVANALKMYKLLQSRGKMKAGEIAKELNVTPRMVKTYKEALYDAGIYIGSNLGRDGGYYLENYMSLRGMHLQEEELEALKMASEVIRGGAYHYSTAFETLTSKILNSKNSFEVVPYYSKKIISSHNNREKAIWESINRSIAQKKKLKMKYGSIGTENQGTDLKERIVHMYGLFDYKGATYCYGYCELRKKVRIFKLSRIKKYEILQEKFLINVKYDLEKLMKQSFGIYTDDIVDIKLEIYYPMSQIVREKIYSETQKIEKLDENAICFTAAMRGYTELKSWVMSMGSLAKVIEPEVLREDILDETKKIINHYSV